MYTTTPQPDTSILSPDQKSRIFDHTIPGRLLMNISCLVDPTSMLVFGCGTSHLPYAAAVYFPHCTVKAYDRSEEKIRLATNSCVQHIRVEHTDKKPSGTFDVVLGLAVMHENPPSISREIASHVRLGGCAGIIDYDMKGMDINEFLSRWGQVRSETRERSLLGDEQAHEIHTRFGLEDCLELMDQAGLNRKLAIPKVIRPGMRCATIHFIYLGQKGLAPQNP